MPQLYMFVMPHVLIIGLYEIRLPSVRMTFIKNIVVGYRSLISMKVPLQHTRTLSNNLKQFSFEDRCRTRILIIMTCVVKYFTVYFNLIEKGKPRFVIYTHKYWKFKQSNMCLSTAINLLIIF